MDGDGRIEGDSGSVGHCSRHGLSKELHSTGARGRWAAAQQPLEQRIGGEGKQGAQALYQLALCIRQC